MFFICHILIFYLLFFHYLINISIHFNQQRYILLIAVISSIVWTGICKTYEGIIRYSTLVELTRIIYAMLLKAHICFVCIYNTGLHRIVHLFHHYNRFYQFRFPAHVYTDINRQFLLSFITAFKKPRQATLIYGISERGISLANYLRSENNPYNVFGFITRNPKTRNTGLWDIRYI